MSIQKCESMEKEKFASFTQAGVSGYSEAWNFHIIFWKTQFSINLLSSTVVGPWVG